MSRGFVTRWSHAENCEVYLTPDDYEDCECGECYACELENEDWEGDYEE